MEHVSNKPEASGELHGMQWTAEARAVIEDVKYGVKDIEISELIPVTSQQIHLNLTTLEEEKYCIELSSRGFLVCGTGHNVTDKPSTNYHETLYSFLNIVSPMYRDWFGNELVAKLTQIKDASS